MVSLHTRTVSLNSRLYPPPLMEEEVPFELEPIGSIEHSCKYIHTYIHIYIYTHTHIHIYIYIYIWWSSLAALKTVVNTYYMVPLVDSVNSSFFSERAVWNCPAKVHGWREILVGTIWTSRTFGANRIDVGQIGEFVDYWSYWIFEHWGSLGFLVLFFLIFSSFFLLFFFFSFSKLLFTGTVDTAPVHHKTYLILLLYSPKTSPFFYLSKS